jgi:hypothetical protein
MPLHIEVHTVDGSNTIDDPGPARIRGGGRRRLARAAIAVAVLVGSFAVGNRPATAESPRVMHCVAPDGLDVPAGTDLNALFGESATIASQYYSCGTILAGSPWTVIIGFNFAKTWQHVPPGYVPAAPTPRQDFMSKLVAVRYAIDQGTPHEFSVEFANSPSLWIGDLNGYDPSIGDYNQYDWAQTMTLGSIRPLSVGTHTVQKSVIMSGPQCDGIHSDFDASCLPGGETVVGTAEYQWVARQPAS